MKSCTWRCKAEDEIDFTKSYCMCGLWTGAFRCPGGRTDHRLYGGNLAAGQTEEYTGPEAPMNFEMEEVDALELLIPKYITSMIYGGLLEASASENGARMQAMDAATSNAEDMIDDLTLAFNRARQSSITQELTEIIAGAQAIS